MAVQHQGIIARFFDLLDGIVVGDPVDILSEDFEFEMVFPGVEGPPDERVSGGKEDFRQFMESLLVRGPRPRQTEADRRHHINALTVVDGVELMIGTALGGRRQGTLVAAAEEDQDGKMKRYVVVMTSVRFPEIQDR